MAGPVTLEAFEEAVLRGRATRCEDTPRGRLRAVPMRGTGVPRVTYTLDRLAVDRGEVADLFPLETEATRVARTVPGLSEAALLDLLMARPEFLTDPYHEAVAGPLRRRHAELRGR